MAQEPVLTCRRIWFMMQWLGALCAEFLSVVGCPSGQREQTVNLSANAFRGSNPRPTTTIAYVAQSAERVLGKDKVTGSTPVVGSSITAACAALA